MVKIILSPLASAGPGGALRASGAGVRWLLALAGVGAILAGAAGIVGPARLLAQIEGDRGIAPVVSTGDIEVNGIAVNTTGKTAQEARAAGWTLAYRLAWQKINGPQLDDAALEGLVSQVEVEHEQIGPHRYIATLGIVFDRSRAGQFVAGAGGQTIRRSAPMLVIPVLYSGGVAQVYEVRGDWQRAWAEFRTGASVIDYVRPSGSGGDSLLLTAGQPGRRSRLWWRGLLDAYGASDVLIPEARLERQWPGGPVNGLFTARYGPDNGFLESFTLTAPDNGGIPAMLAQAITRFDRIYADALARGLLNPGMSLSIDHPAVNPGLASLMAIGQRAEAADAAQRAAAEAAANGEGTPDGLPLPATPGATPSITPSAVPEHKSVSAAYVVQFVSPDAQAVDQALAGVRSTPGVSAATTTSIAIGGTSVMRVSYGGSITQLAAALRERGWQVTASATALRVRRSGN